MSHLIKKHLFATALKENTLTHFQANLGRTIWGVVGLGAFGFQRKELAKDKRIITTTRSHCTKLVNDCIDSMNPTEVMRVGGAGNKVCDDININLVVQQII